MVKFVLQLDNSQMVCHVYRAPSSFHSWGGDPGGAEAP